MKKQPKLTLVGAGPGDPELITVKGVKALESADVVLYDALVHPDLLNYAPQAVHIPVGKRAGKESVSQSTINELIREMAFEHGHVVRLKGGDPFVFGRGFEELEYAAQHGLKLDMVLGISSIMLPGYYGIPLTVRGVNQSITIVTASTADGTLSDEAKRAAEYSPTTLFFMGLKKIDLLVNEYQKHGRGQLPVAIISKGTLPKSKVLIGDVDSIEALVHKKKPETPALLIFGEGAALARQRLIVNGGNEEEVKA